MLGEYCGRGMVNYLMDAAEVSVRWRLSVASIIRRGTCIFLDIALSHMVDFARGVW